MRIENQTCYRTDDIAALVEAVDSCLKLAAEKRKNWEHTTLRSTRPELLIVSDYVPAVNSANRSYCYGGGRWAHMYRLCEGRFRLGIVHPRRLPLVPLVVLAQCADDDLRVVPEEVLSDLVRVIAFAFTDNHLVLGDFQFSWLRNLGDQVANLRLRFEFEVNEAAEKQANLAFCQAKLKREEERLAVAKRQAERARQSLDRAEERVAAAAARVETRRERLRQIQEGVSDRG